MDCEVDDSVERPELHGSENAHATDFLWRQSAVAEERLRKRPQWPALAFFPAYPRCEPLTNVAKVGGNRPHALSKLQEARKKFYLGCVLFRALAGKVVFAAVLLFSRGNIFFRVCGALLRVFAGLFFDFLS